MLSPALHGDPPAELRRTLVTLVDLLFEIVALAVSLALAGSLTR